MKQARFAVGLCLLWALMSAWPAMAGRCLDVPDGQLVWCEDFDNYCVGGAPWPGYPPLPAACATDGSAVVDNAAFLDNWPQPAP